MLKTYTLALLLAGGSLTACGKNTNATEVGVTNATATCAKDPRVTSYADGMTFKGRALSIKLLSSDPSPPGVELNTWTFQVLDAQGQPVTGATVTLAPYMPDHGHGPSVVPTVSASGSTYTVSNIDLFMPGVWQMTFNVTDGSAQDQAVVDFCVAG